MVSFQEAYAVKEANASKMLQQEYISGVGVGYLDPQDENQGAAIVVYVSGQPVDSINIPDRFEAEIEGTKVSAPSRIVTTGEFFANTYFATRPATLPASLVYSQRIRPVPGGYSVGTPAESGTAGLIVLSADRTQLYVLSCNHVLNKDNSNGYTETIQPGGADGGISGNDTIGRLDRFIPLQKTNNYLDAATAIPLSNDLLNPTYATKGTLPGHYIQYSVGWNFYKVGRTTGPVTGKVDSVHTDVTVNYGNLDSLGQITFKDQSIVKGTQAVSLPGDSGSVWLRAEDNYACAVNYAGPQDGLYSICYPVNWFMQAFNCIVAQPASAATTALAAPADINELMLSSILSDEVIKSLSVQSAKAN